jgi:hypothetical protein
MIDSADRSQTSSLNNAIDDATLLELTQNQSPLNNFVIQKRQPFLSGYFTRLAVTEVRFEYNSPNVNARNNKLRVLDEAATEHEITIPENFYTPDALAAELDTLLTAAIPGQTWNVTYQENSFQIDSNKDFLLYPYIYSTIEQTLAGLFYMMGFNTYVNGVPDTSQAGAIFPSMTYTKYIDVCSRSLTQYQRVKDNSTRENQTPAVLCRIYVGGYSAEGVGDGGATATSIWPGCAPAIIHRIYNVPKYSSWSPGQYIDQIDIQLRDDTGALLYIPGNSGDEALNAKTTANSFQLTLHASEN